MEEAKFELNTIVSQLSLLAATARQTLSSLQSMRELLRSPLPIHLQLRWPTQSNVVFLVCAKRSNQLLIHHLLCHLLCYDRRIHIALHAWLIGGDHILWTWLGAYMHFGTANIWNGKIFH